MKTNVKKEKKSKRETIIKTILIVLLVGALIGLGVIFYNDYLDNKKNGNSIFESNAASHFNFMLESYSGIKSGFSVHFLLDDIVASNNKGKREILVLYEDELINKDEIEGLNQKISDDHNYSVKFSYDDKKFINKAIIKRVITKDEINSYNSFYEHMYNGSVYGSSVKNLFDRIILNNSKEDNKITVSFRGHETNDADEIRGLKKKIETFTEYEIIYKYNDLGFINKAVVE